jgi:hypothetical protein
MSALVPLFERTRMFKACCSAVVPGLVQTPEYAHALLSSISVFHGTVDDVADAVAARMNRNRVLRDGNPAQCAAPGVAAGGVHDVR